MSGLFYDLANSEWKIPQPFYGVDSEYFRLGAGTFLADSRDDGYDGSYLVGVVDIDDEYAKSLIFFERPIDYVSVHKTDEGFCLIGTDDHVWLEFGTDCHTDSYYPMFYFNYTPKEAKVTTEQTTTRTDGFDQMAYELRRVVTVTVDQGMGDLVSIVLLAQGEANSSKSVIEVWVKLPGLGLKAIGTVSPEQPIVKTDTKKKGV